MGKLGCRNQRKIVFCLEYEGKNKSYSTVQVYTSVYYYVCGIMNYVLLFNNVHYYIIQYIIYILFVFTCFYSMHRYFLDMHKMLFWLCPDVKDINCESRKDYVFQLGPWPQSITINSNWSRSRTERIFVDLCGCLSTCLQVADHTCQHGKLWSENVQIQRNPTWTGLQRLQIVRCTSLERPFLAVCAWSQHWGRLHPSSF
jgi:hypothetical protein